MQRNCLKCHHVNTAATGDESEACPKCGAIYSLIEKYIAERGHSAIRPAPAARSAATQEVQAPPGKSTPESPRTEPPPMPPAPPRKIRSDQDYIKQLRAESNYPTFRQVIGVFTVVGYLMAAFSAFAAFLTIKAKGGGVDWSNVSLIFLTIIIVIVTKAAKEASLMAADASDALVRLAARSDDSL